MYLMKTKELHSQKLHDDGKREFMDTLRFDMFWGSPTLEDSSRCKVGHIEVGVAETDTNHFAERLEQFLIEASKLYDEVVLGNTKHPNEFELVELKK